MDSETTIDRFYGALTRGDLDEVRACCSSQALFWHNFDGVAQALDIASKSWAALIAHTAERRVEDVRRRTLPDGLLQQHMFVLRTIAGERKAWAVCIIVKISDGLIVRLEEYIDREGSFRPGEGPVVTPEMPATAAD